MPFKFKTEYSPEHKQRILWSDPNMGIKWLTNNITMIKKAQLLPRLKNIDNTLAYC
jgi:dTDP-4-dehydrorhamnose 3,5-epimerase-like enzyme